MNSEHPIDLGQIELVLDEDPATVPSNWFGVSNHEDLTYREALLCLSPGPRDY